jgi:hypothetical protein
MNDEDALKIRQYFSIAPLDAENFQLIKKIYPISRKIQLTYPADVSGITQDTLTDPQDPGSILSATYAAFLERYTLKTTSDKQSTSVVKKSKKKKSGPKQLARVEKTRKKKKLDDGTEFLQSARKQLDKANALIERMNKKTTISPRKINKNFL